MKILVTPGACVGHGRCALVAPALLKLDDNGYLAGTTFDVPAGQESLARRAVRACPERALVLREEDAAGGVTGERL